MHTDEWFWSFSDKCDVSLADDGSIVAINGNQKVILKSVQKVTATLYRGDEDKPLGGVLRNYDVKDITI